MWKLFSPLLFIAATLSAQEQGTAYDALRVLGQEAGRDAVNRVISIVGIDGAPQPEKWKLLVADQGARGGVREIEIGDGRIISERAPREGVIGSSESATINTARLNLDSTGAYAVASHTADKSGTPFATVSYTLRSAERGDPVWIVTLRDEARWPVGTIYVGANRGNVTRTEGLFAGATMQDVVTTPREVETGERGVRGILSTTKSSISHGFYVAQHEARDMFERVKRSFADFMDAD